MNHRTTLRLRLCTVLLCLNLLFIWGNSLLPGELSEALSQWVKALLGFGSDRTDTGHHLLRKIAHFSEFACLGLCLQWLHTMLEKPMSHSILWGFAAACTDELIQCFVPDRGPSITDVLIDTVGVITGSVLLYAVWMLQKRKIKENES